MLKLADLLEGDIPSLHYESSLEKHDIGDIEEAIEKLARNFYAEADMQAQAEQQALENQQANAALAQEVAALEMRLSGGGGGSSEPPNMYNTRENASGFEVPDLCPPGMYYDPVHQVCSPNLVDDPQQGYGQVCPDGYVYDAEHGVCTNYMTPDPQAYFPR